MCWYTPSPAVWPMLFDSVQRITTSSTDLGRAFTDTAGPLMLICVPHVHLSDCTLFNGTYAN